MNNMMVREIHGAKINPKSSLKNQVAQITRGAQITRLNTVLVSGAAQPTFPLKGAI
jgi:hypothetical protein